jgi:hypothetical protein
MVHCIIGTYEDMIMTLNVEKCLGNNTLGSPRKRQKGDFRDTYCENVLTGDVKDLAHGCVQWNLVLSAMSNLQALLP